MVYMKDNLQFNKTIEKNNWVCYTFIGKQAFLELKKQNNIKAHQRELGKY